MHGGFGGHGGGGGGHVSSGHSGHSGHNPSGGHSGQASHMGGHAGGGHPMHASHHHGGGHKDNVKGAHAQTKGQALLNHAAGLVHNGQGVLGHIAAALTGHHGATAGHGATTNHALNSTTVLQAEKTDSSDAVGRSGSLSHPDNFTMNGMAIKRASNEPRVALVAIFAGLLIWMLVVQVFSGGGPGRHKRVAQQMTPQHRPLPGADVPAGSEEAAGTSVAPLLNLLSMAQPNGPSLLGAKTFQDDPNSDPNEATQTDSPRQADVRDAENSEDIADQAKNGDDGEGANSSQLSRGGNSDQLAAAMQIFQPQGMASQKMTSQGMVSQGAGSMRTMSQRQPMSARLTRGASSMMHSASAPAQNSILVQTAKQAPLAPTMLQAETLKQGAQATYASGSFGGPRTLSADEPFQVEKTSANPFAGSIFQIQKPQNTTNNGSSAATANAITSNGATASSNTAASQEMQMPAAASTSPTAFANLFVAPGVTSPNGAQVAQTSRSNPSAAASMPHRRWRNTPVANANSNLPANHHLSAANRNTTIADASIYSPSSVDNRKRVLTER